MRNLFDGSRRGRRPDRSGPAPTEGSPYDFGAPDDGVDPVDLLAIRADEELLDALASGRPSLGGFHDARLDGLDTGFQDDQRLLTLLQAWRGEVDDEPIPELISADEASEAIVAGHRGRPRRRLMPVAAAAAVVVLGLSGVAFGAGTAKPGDALWGVSKTLDGDHAASVEAAERVTVALASAQRALAEGRVSEAQVTLASVAPELAKVTDEEAKEELARKSANLSETAEEAEEGEQVRTDESGKRHKDPDRKDADTTGSTDPKSSDPKASDPKSSDPKSSDPKSEDETDPKARDPRNREPGQGGDSRSGSTSAKEPSKPSPDGSSSSPKPDKPPSSPPPSKPDKPDQGEGEGEGEGTADPKPTVTPGSVQGPVAPTATPPPPPPEGRTTPPPSS